VSYQGYFFANSCTLNVLRENREVGQEHFFLNIFIVVIHYIFPFFLSDLPMIASQKHSFSGIDANGKDIHA
jgi:hypothetical protein